MFFEKSINTIIFGEKAMQELDRIVPDTSVIIEGLLSKKIQKKELKVSSILIHEASLAELEHQANKSREIGHMGLDELKKLKDISTQYNFEIKYLGHRPKAAEIRYASLGEIDSLIRELAYVEDATLITGDKVQFKVAQSKGIKVIFLKPEVIRKKLSIEKYFDEHTMSVHIRENIPVYAKRGLPGSWDFVELSKEKLNADQIEDIAKELTEETKVRRDGFVEIERQNSTIIQLGSYRIVIVRPPFSDGWEITIVKPIKKLALEDYKLDQELTKRIDKGAEGILIAGSPGQGKCLSGEEIIYTKNFRPIKVKDFYKSKYNTVYSIDKNGKFVEDYIISKHQRKEKILHRIKTRTNKIIDVTAEHPLLKLTEKGEFKWIEAKKLKENDLIAVIKRIKTIENDSIDFVSNYQENKTICEVNIDKNVPIYCKYLGAKRAVLFNVYTKKSLEELKFSKKYIRQLIRELLRADELIKKDKKLELKKAHYSLKEYPFINLLDLNKNQIPHSIIEKITVKNFDSKQFFINNIKKITPEFSRLLGYICSEGGGEKFSFTNANQELVDDFKFCAKQALGIDHFKKYNITYYIDSRSSIQPLLEAVRYPIRQKNKSINLNLPEFLFTCSLDNLSNFLGAYFDGDGSVNKSNSIEYYTSSKEAANQISILLLRLSIFSKVNSKVTKGRERYTVNIFDLESINIFRKKIPVISKDKKEKLSLAIGKKYDQTLNYPIKGIISKIKWLSLNPKLKENISFGTAKKLLIELYKRYYEYIRVNENNILILKNTKKEIQTNLEYIKNNKPTYSILRKNKIDHNIIRHYEKGQNIKIETLNKIAKAINGPHIKDSKIISGYIKETINGLKSSINEISRQVDYNQGTLLYKINHGWQTDVDILPKLIDQIEIFFHIRRLELEEVIKKLNIILESDIIFDKVRSNNILEGNFEVYDFETTNHNFICGKYPMVIHNSTFAAAVSEYFAQKNKIVKTIEAPRDLQLSDHITQYAISYGTPQEIHDILLLSRPDYVVFDEMRDTRDFKLYSDLRLSGIGMLGVLHATTPIDSIQRFIGRIEVGMIPSILDTIIFIQSGTVSKAMTLKMSVKVPTGMIEADLARPVIEIRDFKSKELLYEIYSYGEETVVIPTGQVDKKSSKVQSLAKKELERELKKVTDEFKVEFLSDSKIALYVPETQMAKIIGKQGKNISELEDHLGLSIDVMELKEPSKNTVDFDIIESRKAIILKTKKDFSRRIVNVFVDQKLLFSNKLSKHSEVLINRKSSIGKVLQEALNQNKKIEVFL